MTDDAADVDAATRQPASARDRPSDSPGNGGPLGAVLAGGESSRYGSPKALATVGGTRIIDRVVDTLRAVTPEIILSANEPALFRDLGLPIHADVREGLGPLGGIYTTLLRAREAGRPGILAVACDMPFPSTSLLTLLRATAFGPDADADLVLPASRGRRGVEPLFGAYRTTCLAAIDAALAEGDRRMIGFHERVETRTIPLDVVESLCDPERAFLNVNTPEDRARAERMAAGREHGDA
ncbi:MAG: molybdenum cofactor guanylyltransferase [Candidatus Longimicrobiales bacterium M2_2A_002]